MTQEVAGVPRRSRDRPIEPVPRRLLTRAEAAASLGMSVAHFERYVQPFVKVVPCGQLLLIEPGSLGRRARSLRQRRRVSTTPRGWSLLRRRSRGIIGCAARV